jgi:hypothetical protein
MSEQDRSDGLGNPLERLETVESIAWQLLEGMETPREKLSVLKTIADLLTTRLRLGAGGEVKDAAYYEEQYRQLRDRIKAVISRERRTRQKESG